MNWLPTWLSPPAFWGLFAAFPAVLAEYLYRTLHGSWFSHIYLWIPIQLTIGYGIFRLVTIPNTTLMDAFVIWALSTIAMRVFVSTVILHDHVKMGTWIALGLIILARTVQAWMGR